MPADCVFRVALGMDAEQMKIAFEIDYNDAKAVRECLSKHMDLNVSADTIAALDEVIENEDERRGSEHAEGLLESGGTDDSRYRAEMKDAGRGHLLR